MRLFRLAIVVVAALASGACFQFSTVLHVNADGTGTIQERLLFTQAALAQIRQFTAFGGGSRSFDPLSEQDARDQAASFGPGVTYVSSTPINTGDGQGRDVTYAFRDINQVRLGQLPPAPGGLSVSMPNLGTDAQLAFALNRRADGVSVLRVISPQLQGAGTGGPATMLGRSLPSTDQMAMARSMFAGARINLAIEPAGSLVRTSSPYVDGRLVTIVDVNLDALLSNDALLQRLQAAKSPDDMKAALNGAQGIRVNVEPEVTIEFK